MLIEHPKKKTLARHLVNIVAVALVGLVACAAAFTLLELLAGCAVNPTTGARELDTATAQGYITAAQSALDASGASSTPLGVAASSVLALASLGLGAYAKRKRSQVLTAAEKLALAEKALEATILGVEAVKKRFKNGISVPGEEFAYLVNEDLKTVQNDAGEGVREHVRAEIKKLNV